MSIISTKTILTTSTASLLAGCVMGTSFLSIYQNTEYDDLIIYSLGEAILYQIPSISRWRFDEAMKTCQLRDSRKSKAQLNAERGIYSAARGNPARADAELGAVCAMILWFVVSSLVFVASKVYGDLSVENFIRNFKAYWNPPLQSPSSKQPPPSR